MINGKKAVVLLSGGLDSATTLAIAKDQGFDAYALSFRRPQDHRIRIDAAKRVARAIGVLGHLVVDLAPIGSGGTGSSAHRWQGVEGFGRETPATAIALRDAILTSFALAWAGLLTRDFFIHMNPMDPGALAGGPPEYLEAYGCLLSQSRRPTGWGSPQVRVHTPLAGLSKAQIIQQGLGLGVDYALTVSCRDPSPGGEACGRCGSCMRRMQGFEETGIPDPARYYARMREAV